MAIFTACQREEIRVYTAPKDAPAHEHHAGSEQEGEPPQAAPPEMQRGPSQTATWKVPDGWQEREPGSRGGAKFTLPASEDGQRAEAAVLPFGGKVPKASVLNIFRGDFKLAALSEEEWTKIAQPVAMGPLAAELYEMVSDKPVLEDKFKARVCVVIGRNDDTTWFARMSGGDELVAKYKPQFLEFLKSLQFQAATAESPVRDSAGAGQPRWMPATGWKEVAAGPMQVAKFTVGNDANTMLTISSLPGDAGGPLPNITRWRGQLGLPPVSQADLPSLTTGLEVAGGKAMLVDMSGTDAKSGRKSRMIVASVEHGGSTWFYKLMGDDAVVESQKAAFVEFVKTVQYP